VKMFDARHKDCVFIEQFTVARKFGHLSIECIPLDRNVSNLAPIYFKVDFSITTFLDDL
jgi:hypothetical protein